EGGVGKFDLPAIGGSRTFSLAPGTITMTETVKDYYATEIDCTDGSSVEGNIVVLTILPGNSVSCTFTSTQRLSAVSGTVQDASGVGIEGAIVSLTETSPAANAAVMSADLSAVTDGDGNYAIGDVPLGEYTLSVILPGESEPAHTQSISVGANLVNEIDPIIVSTSEDLYLPSVRKR
ncbi:MAG: carboxypeptidase-like regulatory domain-containing protein, partial [Caldilineaceae bacterium]